jgi:histidinol-phosphate aminotransferase
MITNPLTFVRPEVRSQSAYTLRQPPHRIKLNQNENPFGFPAELKKEVFRRLQEIDWARYPDFHLERLTEGLAHHAGVPPDWLLPGNGSNELLQMTLLTCLSPGNVVILPVPSFSLYRLQSTFLGALIVPIQLRPEDKFTLPVDRVIRAARDQQARIVVLCSPNNPTGNTYPEAVIRRVVEESRALVLLDEAYREFSDQDFAPLLHEYANLVLFRTFSKARAMAGLRVGYMLARPEFVREVSKVKLPYGLNLMSETTTLVALEHPEVFESQVRELRRLRDRLVAELSALPGVHPYPSQANFVLCGFDRPLEEVFVRLVEDGILVRDVSGYPGLVGHLRISIGTADENAALVASLSRLAAPG